MRLSNDEKGVSAVFLMIPVYDEAASKKKGRPVFNDVEHCRVTCAGFTKEKILDVPAMEISHMQEVPTTWGTTERQAITYAQRFNKQYLEFKAGGTQSYSGTPLEELTFLTESKRRELRAIGVTSVEMLAAIDGTSLKMLGPGGRDLKNQAMVYMEKAAQGVSSQEQAVELTKRDERIEALERQLAALSPTASVPLPIEPEATDVTTADVATFETFTDEDLQNMLKEAGAAIDGRWSRNTLITKYKEIAKTKAKKAA